MFISAVVIIIAGFVAYQKIWVPRTSEQLIDPEPISDSKSEEKIYSPLGSYYAIQRYVKSEQVTCCGNEEEHERKLYSVSVYESNTNKLIKIFTEFNIDNYEGYTPSIYKWYSDDILQMDGLGIVDALGLFYNIKSDKLVTEWEFNEVD